MCLIVDNNVRDMVFFQPAGSFAKLNESLFGRRIPAARIVVGGKLYNEYVQRPEMIRVLGELFRAGRYRRIDDQAVNAEEVAVKPNCQSDDPHVIALARVAGVRLLCSDDQTLHIDFKRQKLIAKPRGTIYVAARHQQQIKKHCCK